MIQLHLIKRLYHSGLLALVLLCLLSSTNFVLAHSSNEPLAHDAVLSVLKLEAFQKGMQLYHQKDLNGAAQALDVLLKRFPDNPIILNNLAVITSEQNKHALSIHYLKAAIASNKLLNISYKNLSALYLYQAAKSYQQALALDAQVAKPASLQIIEQATLAKAMEAMPLAKDMAKDPVKDLLKNKQLRDPLVEDPLPQTPATTKRPSTNSQKIIAAVTQHIQNWAKAWSKQNTKNYFLSYVPGYAPGNLSARQWKAMRTQRIRAPRTINVKVRDLKFDLYNEKLVTVVLTQIYNSNVFTSSTVKQLRLIRSKEGWKIVDEKVIR